MKLPTLAGIIKRRILVNFRADPDVVQKILPGGLRPKLYNDQSVVGICLIRLENIRPKFAPSFVGIDSENAAHRISVEWDEDGEIKEGVYIPRRDTNSALNAFAGGKLFPGEHNRAEFNISETERSIDFKMLSDDEKIRVKLNGTFSDDLPKDSVFGRVEDASEFFRGGSLGYSVTREGKHLDGISLETKEWKVRPLEIEKVESSFYENKAMFPEGSVIFDHALIMQNVEHEWHSAREFKLA
jgi:hypothetical protein